MADTFKLLGATSFGVNRRASSLRARRAATEVGQATRKAAFDRSKRGFALVVVELSSLSGAHGSKSLLRAAKKPGGKCNDRHATTMFLMPGMSSSWQIPLGRA